MVPTMYNNNDYYMALACGRYNARSDRLRARSERSLRSRNAHGPIADYAN